MCRYKFTQVRRSNEYGRHTQCAFILPAGLTDDVDGRVAIAVTVVVNISRGRVIHSLCIDGKVLIEGL